MKKVLQINKYPAICNVVLILMLMFSFSGCNDYGKEIEQLQTQISELQKSINSLKEAHESGKIISQILSAEDSKGYEIVFSDGTKIALNHGNHGSDGVDGNDGNDGSDGADGVTPIIKIDTDGYWIVSYDGEVTFTRILDASSNPIPAVVSGIDGLPGMAGTDGADGLCVRVTTDEEGLYIFEVYSPSFPDKVIDRVVTPYSSDASSAIASIVKDEENGKIVLTMCDGTVFEFNLDVAYPTSLVVLEDVVHIDALNDGVITFRLNPSDAYVSFFIDAVQPSLELDVVTSPARSGENVSYVTSPKGYKITSVKLDETEDGNIKQGQYKAEISSLNNCENPLERVCLVLTTKNSKGETIRLSSTPFAIVNGEGTEIMSISINGIEAEKTGNVFHVKLPPTTNLKSLTPEFVGNCTSISVKQEEASRAMSESYDFSSPVTFVATGPDGKTEEYIVAVTFSNLPVVYVTTPAPIVSKDDWVKNCAIQIVNSKDYAGTYESVQMKGRGNSTWGYPKKPYAIKLDKKAEVLGMPKHKRWVLLANWMDRTNMRNDVAFEIGRRMSGLAWTPRGKFVDVVFNGRYQGNYYLCEQIKIDSNRVNIDEMKTTDINMPEITGGYLLEFDTNYDEVNKFRTDLLHFPVNFKDPDEDVLQQEQFEYIKNYVNDVEAKLVNHAEYAEIESLIDMDSYIDWWLLHELAINGEPGHPKSSYMYKARNGKLFAGPIWDFDWGTFSSSYQNRWVIPHAIWYPYLLKYPKFIEKLKERWQEYRNSLEAVAIYIENIGETLKESGMYDCQMWPIKPGYTGGYINGDELLSYPESIDQLKSRYIQRFNWIDENISKLTATEN